MQDVDVLDQGYAENQMGLSTQAIAHLKESAKWGTFLAIVGFVFIGLFMVLAIFMGVFMDNMQSDLPGYQPNVGPIISISYMAMGALYIYPTLKLFQFSKKAKQAIAGNDSVQMTESLGNLKSMFKFMGVLMAVVISFYALALVFGLIGFLMMDMF